MAKLEAAYSYTDAELLALFREAYAKISVSGQGYKIGTREFTAADLQHVRDQIDWLQRRVDGAAGGLKYNPVRLKPAT